MSPNSSSQQPTAADASPRSAVLKGLQKVWLAQRRLLRVLEAQRELAPVHHSAFAVEVVTDGYYLVRKNLFDLVALNRDLPLTAKESPGDEASSPAESNPTDRSVHGILAYDLAAMHALAADYATLHAESLAAGARDIGAVVHQHGRLLKSFLSNLFPEGSGS